MKPAITNAQLILKGLRQPDEPSLENFYPGPNARVLHYLTDFTSRPEKWLTYLWGSTDVGRTHLLLALSRIWQQSGRPALYFPLAEFKATGIKPDILTQLDPRSLLCFDDLETIVGQPEWELALFHLYNQNQQGGGAMVFSARVAPRFLPFLLPDLQSRLMASTIFHLQSLPEEDKIAALQLRASQRGLILSQEVGDFLLKRVSRRLQDLFKVLDNLDQASLAAQRRLTIPFVKSVLQC